MSDLDTVLAELDNYGPVSLIDQKDTIVVTVVLPGEKDVKKAAKVLSHVIKRLDNIIIQSSMTTESVSFLVMRPAFEPTTKIAA